MTNEQYTFIHLKFFPRWQRGNKDAGQNPTLMNPEVHCANCGELLYETVSLEFCVSCGYVDTDYWGIITQQDILTTRRHKRE